MDMTRRVYAAVALATCLVFILGSLLANASHAASAKEIDTSVDVALERFYKVKKRGQIFILDIRIGGSPQPLTYI